VPGVYGISLRRKIGFTVTIVFFSMLMLVYFLVFCRASLVLTSGFLITTFFTVAVLVSLYFRSVKAAFDEILRTARRVSHGGGELLHLGSNEKELVEFAEHFNDSVCETIALRENLEVQVNERTRELSLKAEELAEANDRLRELDRLKSRFLSSVSHELRTPLTSILGFSQIILRDLERAVLPLLPESGNARAKADRICTNVGVIRREGERLTRLINGVLDLARIESGRMEWRDTWVGLSSCIEQAVQVVEGASDRNPDVMLKVQAESSLPKIFADPDRIVQVLVNLLNNAFKFTRNGEVRVSAGKGDTGELEVSVSDTGPGMPPEELDSVFERFHQVEGREGRPVGTGLGLAICREIVEHYGGRIRAESRIGRGCRFVFILPAGDSGRELFE
jgi:signal transduction histidine kinase